ncbi:MAG: glycoside hydrolase family 5 protein [Acetatifactor sp.]|nr:glycoside hydrolase family 5 protein [Acetatifactor sp.]
MERRKVLGKGFGWLLAALCLMVLVFGTSGKAAGSDYTGRPSVNGRLHVEGNALADASGQIIQLRGVSSHGLTWYADFINESLFTQVSKDWNCNMIRLAMYANIYCSDEKELSYSQMKKGIDAAVKADMYVLVDWHMLEYGNPNDQVEEAKKFFERITRTHTIEVLDFNGQEMEWLQLLYDRIPTLPQSLQRDFGVVSHLWQNIAHRVARTRK